MGEELKQLIFFDWLPIKPDPAAVYDRPPYPFDDEVLDQFIGFFNAHWEVLKNAAPHSRLRLAALIPPLIGEPWQIG